MTTREQMIWELDKREAVENIPNRRGILARCYGSQFYRKPPRGTAPCEPQDWELEMASGLTKERQ